MKTLIALLCLAITASAGAVGIPAADSAVDPAILRIDEPRHLGQPLDGSVVLVDAAGRPFRLAEVFGKPTILLLSYFGCDGSCPTMNIELAKVLARVQRFRAGRDYNVLTVSFDAADSEKTAAAFVAKTAALAPALAGWRHAVLQDRDTERFAGQLGFRFFWSDGAKAFLHPNVVVFLTPEGRVARYLYGFRLDPRNVELALVDADWSRIADSTALFDMMTGACFSFNYATGRYQWNAPLLAGIGSLLTGCTALGLAAWAYRRRRTAHG